MTTLRRIGLSIAFVSMLALGIWLVRRAGSGVVRQPEQASDATVPQRAAPSARAPRPGPAGRAADETLQVPGAAGSGAPVAMPDPASQAPVNRVRQRLHALWLSEAEDEAWTREATQALHESALAMGVELRYPEPVACRQSVCRTVFQVADAAQLSRLAQLSWHKAAVLYPAANAGPLSYELYVAKEGSELASRLSRRGVARRVPAPTAAPHPE